MNVFSSVSNMKICCVFSLESPHPWDSNEYLKHKASSVLS